MNKYLVLICLFFASFFLAQKINAQNIANNVINGAQAICPTVQAGIISGTLPTGGTGTYSYSWLQSSTGSATGFIAATGTNNTQNYQPPLLASSRWYKRVVNSGSYTDTSIVVWVNVVSSITLTPSGSTNFCSGDSVTLCSGVAGNNAVFQWMMSPAGSGVWTTLPGTANNCYTVHYSGDYVVNFMTVNGVCNVSSNTVTVNVNANALASIAPAGNDYVCQGTTDTLVANVVPGLSYQWYLNGSPIAGATNISYIAAAAGAYQMFVNAGSCQALSDTTVVIIQNNPIATIGATGPTTVCQGNAVSLVANNNPNYQYQWYQGANVIPGANSFTYAALTAGNYSVKETYNGCSGNSNNLGVVVNPVPIATIAIVSGSVQICQGDSALIIANTGTGWTYQWSNNGAPIFGATNPDYFASLSGSYAITITNSFNCSTTSSAINILVLPNPTPNVSVSGNTLSAFGYLIYQWNLNGTPIAGATNSSYTATVSGNYSVHVVTTNGCGGTSLNHHITVNGINDVTQSEIFTLFPNPTKDFLTVQYQDEAALTVYDVTGSVLDHFILKSTNGNNTTQQQIDVRQYANGLYFLKMQNSKYTQEIKFLKE